ncbi:MAG: hypothetical protein HXX17_08045 [Geobacteraceae bacterium]|nr:hypothetical protein [Geobacteraceae bacterium]
MRQEVNVSLITNARGSSVVVQYVGTTIEQVFNYPSNLNLAEALALAAVDMRLNGLPQGVVDTRKPLGDLGIEGTLYEQIT